MNDISISDKYLIFPLHRMAEYFALQFLHRNFFSLLVFRYISVYDCHDLLLIEFVQIAASCRKRRLQKTCDMQPFRGEPTTNFIYMCPNA